MRDCSNCKKKPDAGANYPATPCAGCSPWEPENDSRTVQAFPNEIDRLIDPKSAGYRMNGFE